VSSGTDWIVGIDIGGTFTDGIAINDRHEVFNAKVASTPSDRSVGVLDAVEALADAIGIPTQDLLAQTVKFAHGQTATVNAMVQRDGARVGLITTRGFRDTLEIMNTSRGTGLPQHEAADGLRGQKPASLVPYELVAEVTERVDSHGDVITPLDEEDVRAAVAGFVRRGVESVAVCLLWSFRNPSHEQRIGEIVREVAPELPVTLSSELVPLVGEYERTFTTVTNAYLAPALARYVHSLRDRLRDGGFGGTALIMQSNGGLIPAEESPAISASTLASGLAGGVMGCLFLGRLLGIDNIITSDMGGTSFEVSIIADGEPSMANYPLAPRMGPNLWRWKMALPMIDVTAIGAGGGSIAWVEEGVLKVGPLSAQAEPGPACYGRGGESPTITDADLVLGYLNPDYFLGGKMRAHVDLARAAIEERIAKPLGIDVIDAARGIVDVANSQMSDLLRNLTIRKGHDPRDFHLVAYGGAGPLHVGSFGPDLGVQGMIVPGRGVAAAQSAFGVAIADHRQMLVKSETLATPFVASEIEEHFEELEEQARARFESWGLDETGVVLLRSADMRYGRQIHSVEVPVPQRLDGDEAAAALAAAFEERYERRFGRGTAVPEAGIEITSLRLAALRPTAQPSLQVHEDAGEDPGRALKGERQVFVPEQGTFRSVPTYAGDALDAGNVVEGPAVIEYPGTTIFVRPGQYAETDPYLNVLVKLRP
jgi:N-methylhydantoinase A